MLPSPPSSSPHGVRAMPSVDIVEREWEIDFSQLKRKQLIGQGSFGEVFLGTYIGAPCAIKTILPKLQQQPKLVKQFIEEIILMSTLRCPNVVMFLGACTRVPHLCMVLEYCEYGSLHDFLKAGARHGIKISMSLIFRFALDIARGVYYLHRKCKVVQRDLKARNILIDRSLNAKVADFGLSRVMGDPENGMTACGTPAWTAPEIIRNIGGSYTEKVDVYSFGIVMWEMVARREPYQGQKGVQVAFAAAEGMRPEVPATCPENYAGLMQRCWANDPEERPSFKEILTELFEMKKMTDDESANMRSHGNIIRSRYSVTLPVATLTDDGSTSPQDEAKARGVAGARVAAKRSSDHKSGTPAGRHHTRSTRAPAGTGVERVRSDGAAEQQAWTPDSRRHSNVGTVLGSYHPGGSIQGSFVGLAVDGGSIAGALDVVPTLNQSSRRHTGADGSPKSPGASAAAGVSPPADRRHRIAEVSHTRRQGHVLQANGIVVSDDEVEDSDSEQVGAKRDVSSAAPQS